MKLQALSRQSPIPLYRQLQQQLNSRIEDGDLVPGAMISEHHLGMAYGVSRITTRKALDLLQQDGWVTRVPGKGTFVTERQKLEPMSALTSFGENMLALGKQPSYRTRWVKRVRAGDVLAQRLEVEPDARVLQFERLLMADGVPMAVMRGHVPPRIHLRSPAAWTRRRLDRRSFYSILEEELGVSLWQAKETVEASTAGVDGSLLELDEQAPTLLVHRHTLDHDSLPVEYTQLVYRGDIYRYQVQLFRFPTLQGAPST